MNKETDDYIDWLANEGLEKKALAKHPAERRTWKHWRAAARWAAFGLIWLGVALSGTYAWMMGVEYQLGQLNTIRFR